MILRYHYRHHSLKSKFPAMQMDKNLSQYVLKLGPSSWVHSQLKNSSLDGTSIKFISYLWMRQWAEVWSGVEVLALKHMMVALLHPGWQGRARRRWLLENAKKGKEWSIEFEDKSLHSRTSLKRERWLDIYPDFMGKIVITFFCLNPFLGFSVAMVQFYKM